MKWLRKAAEQGHVNAQHNLGSMYAEGTGVPQGHVEAVRWYREAAEQGHVDAQNNLGAMYAKGTGVPQDDAEAVKWLRKAAEQGHANAQFNLGAMYAKGRGILRDNVQKAYAWLNIAAAQGLAPATGARDFVAQRMTYEDRESAQRLAQQYWEAYVLPFQD